MEKLLKEMNDVPAEDRMAYFHCVIVLLQHAEDPAPVVCHGIWEGEILTQPSAVALAAILCFMFHHIIAVRRS